MYKINDIRDILKNKLTDQEFVTDKSGVKTIELLGVSFIADEDSIFGSPNKDYISREIGWYMRNTLNVYDMPKTPKIWRDIADKDGNINSNYGWLVLSQENGSQFKNVVRTLRKDRDSRRACMIYTRPTMHTDYNKEGMKDFICTHAVNYFIRDSKLHSVVQMRSNDVVFGYKNDYAWQVFILNEILKELQLDYPELQKGDIIWNAASLHVYERHFEFIIDHFDHFNTLEDSTEETDEPDEPNNPTIDEPDCMFYSGGKCSISGISCESNIMFGQCGEERTLYKAKEGKNEQLK